MNRVAVLTELGVLRSHQVRHAFGVALEETGLQRQRMPSLENRAAHDPPQHVAPVLVRGHYPVGDQEGHRPAVISQDPQRTVDRKLLAVATS